VRWRDHRELELTFSPAQSRHTVAYRAGRPRPGREWRLPLDEPRLAASQVRDHHPITAIRAHLATPDHGLMDPAPALYTIRINGHLGAMMLSAFPAMQPELCGAETVLTGVLDRSALYGVLAEIEALGLDLLEVRQLPLDPEGGQQ
jgi:hypothetical protein